MKSRKRFWFKSIAVFVGLNLLTQTFYPTIALALTGGPSQPEMQAFTPVGTTDMVDLSTGSFTYNIPLMDVEGYPINLSYHSGITMDQEASWCGLGWNINPGEINRQMRGIPDDFNSDQITEKFNMKDNLTFGLSAAMGLKLFGLPQALQVSAGIFYNNYKGPGITLGVDPSISCGVPNKGSLTCGLGMNFNSQSGVDISPTMGFSVEALHAGNYDIDAGVKVGTTYNSRTGVKGLQMTKDLNVEETTKVLDANGNQKINPINGSPITDTKETENSSSSFISFSGPTYIPTIHMPLQNYAVTLDATLGSAIIGIHPNMTFSGWFNQQTLATHSQTLPAYGYMYADRSHNYAYALLDFNREKDVPFLPHIANLPVTNFTYDLYSINGEGVSGQFRPFRGDVGILYDHENYNQSLSESLGIELGIGNMAHNGIDANVTTSNTVTDQWQNDNQFASAVGFQGLQPGNINYEPFYIKRIGEKTVNDTNYYNTIGDINPMYISLLRSGEDITAMSMLNIKNYTQNVSSNLMKTRREKRNQCTSLLTAQEANYFALDKKLLSYPLNKNVYSSACDSISSIDSISRDSAPTRQPWHTSEITVTNPDGKRYVYGLPVYNTVQNEATFAVNGQRYTPTNDDYNLISYNSTDRSISNSEGIDNYYDEQYLPPYAHSYLLTSVLSPDYIDMTGNGVSDDDLGQAVKINYTRVYSQSSPYRWRIPFDSGYANNQLGMMSYAQDDKGNIMYGEKEVWYVHSIESKTMVAQFILANREDGFGVRGEEGGLDPTRPLKYLQEIKLYSKADLIAHGLNAVPIKTVHFVYDYSLCPGTTNSKAAPSNGKLTLKQVYFTYGNNNEGSLNSYQFSYEGYNPAFSHSNYDRWGYYKEKTSNPGVNLSNQDFPYTSQNPDSTSKYCTAWNMTDINLPSGGHITVKYQPNDYAYVQNQRAGQMFTVLGASNTPGGPTTKLFSTSGWNNWIVVRIPVHETNTTNFQNDYLAGINQLYFRFAVDVDGSGHYEYVSGYATIGSYQEINDSTWAIQLNPVNSNSTAGNVNPITLASWQYLRLNLPQYAYPGSETNGSVYNLIMGVFGILYDVFDMFAGFNATMEARGGGQNFIPDHSWLRLDNPTYQKLGGGTRVSEIDIGDNWANMANGQSSYTYGQTYNYTTTLAVNGQTKTISSGVATYEPLQGGDENPLRTPLSYSQQEILAPNNEFYTETPLGESLYPAPGVVYSKVTVTNLKHPLTERTETGYTINEFYTAYDFPVLNSWTTLDNERFAPNPLTSLLNFSLQDYTTAAQGFTVEVNDMPGKEKGQEVYDQNGSEISSVHYYYHTDDPNTPSMHLNNDVEVVNPDGSTGIASIGKDIDTYVDMREQETTTTGYGATFNLETFDIFVLASLPIIIPTYSSEDTRFRSAVTTKYIYRSGLIDSVVNMKYGSSVTTQNVAYDAETGNVLLTQTHNEFNEPIYDFTYPAHFAYDGMGSEYKNIGFVYDGVYINGGGFTNPIPSMAPQYFTPGDELEYYNSSNILIDSLVWVTQPQAGGPLSVMDQHGFPVTLNNVLVKVIRSGRRNMPGTPVGNVESMNSPIVSNAISINSSSNILQSNATVFNDVWQVPITEVPVLHCDTLGGPSDSCLANFLDSLVMHQQIWASPTDHITLGKYCPRCGDTSALYYALTPPIPAPAYPGWPPTPWGIYNFYAQLGNCSINIRATPRANDTIGMYYPPGYPPEDLFRVIDDTVWFSDVGWALMTCQDCQTICENLAVNKPFNPYAIGMLGDWRPELNYVYYTARTPSLSASTSNIWNTGLFRQYSPIWDAPGSGGLWPLDTTDKKWTWSSMITKYDTKGNEIEDKDALGRYSGALYGYMQSLPVAVSANAKQEEMAFDGFEDYGFTTSCNNPCYNDHFSFLNSLDYPKVDTTSTTSHTGRYSLEIEAHDSAFATRGINYFSNVLYTTDMYHFYMQNGGGMPLFAPDSGLYLLSAWVKENNCGQTAYPKDSIKIYYAGSALQYIFHSSGPIIEGWQRFEGKFKVPGNATAINVALKAGSNTAYFDDVRIEPFAAEMKTYVYDPFSLRLLATLDENNYATIYEYSDEGILMRVKKETEKGIMTIKESRSSYIRQ